MASIPDRLRARPPRPGTYSSASVQAARDRDEGLPECFSLDSVVPARRLVAAVRLADDGELVPFDLLFGDRDAMPVELVADQLLENLAGVCFDLAAAQVLVAEIADTLSRGEQRRNIGAQETAALPIGRCDLHQVLGRDIAQHARQRAAFAQDHGRQLIAPGIDAGERYRVLEVVEHGWRVAVRDDGARLVDNPVPGDQALVAQPEHCLARILVGASARRALLAWLGNDAGLYELVIDEACVGRQAVGLMLARA